MPEELTREDIEEQGFIFLPEAARMVGKSTRSLERRRQEGNLRVETFRVGRAHRVATRQEWLRDAGLLVSEPGRDHTIEPFHKTSTSDDPIERLLEEAYAEIARLRMEVARLRHGR